MAGLNISQIKDKARAAGRNLSDSEAQSILDSAWDQSQYGADEGRVMALISGGGRSNNGVPTAEDILSSQMNKIKEQVSYLKDLVGDNPFAFDESLARNMATEKFKPYYSELLKDYVDPLQTKIGRSQEDETTALTELTRQTGVGSTTIKRQVDAAVDASREGLAGANLLQSGIGMRGVAGQEIEGADRLKDFTDNQTYKENTLKTAASRDRVDTQKLIEQKERDVFGKGRAYDTAVTQDVESQRGTSNKQYYNKTLMAYSDRFGAPTQEATGYLNSYLNL